MCGGGGGRMGERRRANTWAPLRFVAPLIAECSEDVSALIALFYPHLALSLTYFPPSALDTLPL